MLCTCQLPVLISNFKTNPKTSNLFPSSHPYGLFPIKFRFSFGTCYVNQLCFASVLFCKNCLFIHLKGRETGRQRRGMRRDIRTPKVHLPDFNKRPAWPRAECRPKRLPCGDRGPRYLGHSQLPLRACIRRRLDRKQRHNSNPDISVEEMGVSSGSLTSYTTMLA